MKGCLLQMSLYLAGLTDPGVPEEGVFEGVPEEGLRGIPTEYQ